MAAARTYAWLWLLVALQVAIPASYYFRDDNRDDERFAWRMFSGVRMKRCTVTAQAENAQRQVRDVPLRGALHGSWVHSIERGRRRVIERFLQTRCEPGVLRVTLTRRCASVSPGDASEPEEYAFECRPGLMQSAGGS